MLNHQKPITIDHLILSIAPLVHLCPSLVSLFVFLPCTWHPPLKLFRPSPTHHDAIVESALVHLGWREPHLGCILPVRAMCSPPVSPDVLSRLNAAIRCFKSDKVQLRHLSAPAKSDLLLSMHEYAIYAQYAQYYSINTCLWVLFADAKPSRFLEPAELALPMQQNCGRLWQQSLVGQISQSSCL